MDERVWEFVRGQQKFVRYTEVKHAFLGVHDHRLTTILRRLEKDGKVVRSVGYYKSRPVNVYLAIDTSDPRFGARIINDHGWIFALYEWLDENGYPRRMVSMDLGEFAGYVGSVAGELVVKWPAWADRLAEVGRLSYEDFSWDGPRLPAQPVGLKNEA